MAKRVRCYGHETRRCKGISQQTSAYTCMESSSGIHDSAEHIYIPKRPIIRRSLLARKVAMNTMYGNVIPKKGRMMAVLQGRSVMKGSSSAPLGSVPLMLKAQEEMVRGKRKGEDGGSGVALRWCQAAPRKKKGRPHKRATGKGSVRDDDGGIKIKPRGIARLSFLWSPVVQL